MKQKTITLPKLNNLSPSMESTALKLMEEAGELAQAIGKFRGLNGERVGLKEQEVIRMVTRELLDVAQTAVSMMFVLEEQYGVDIEKAVEEHIQKLINKGYLSPQNEAEWLENKKLRELAARCVSDMGDVFYEPDEWGDYRWGLDEGEEVLEGQTANQRLLDHVTDCVHQALLQAYEMGRAAIQHHGTRTFISGMAQGVDTWAAEIVLEFRAAGASVKLVCTVPFPGQERRWSAEAQDRYRRILEQADEVKILFPHLKPRAALLARNRWMVDRSDAVIAIWNGSSGGTKNTIDYAVKTKKTVFIFKSLSAKQDNLKI